MPLYDPQGGGALYADDPQAAITKFDQSFPGAALPTPVAALAGAGPIAPIDFGNVDFGPTPKIQRPPGFLGRIQQQPGGKKALLAFGAQLLSDPNFFSGLGKGAYAYQQTLDDEAAKYKPQLTKDGAFTYHIDPDTGQPVFNRTPVADFQEGQLQKKLDSAETTSKYRTDVNADVAGKRLDKQDEWHDDDINYKRWRTDKEGDWKTAELRNATEIARMNNDNRLKIAQAVQSGKQVPAGALKEFDEHAAKVNSANGTLQLGNSVLDDLSNGTLNLGIVSNLGNKVAAVTGIGAGKSSRAYSQLQQFTQILVNSILMDARGVQTDGDAERAKIESLVSTGDNEGAKREIANALAMVQRGRDYAQARTSDLARQYGIDAPATTAAIGGGQNAPAPRQSAPARSGQTSSGVKWRIVG